MERLQYIDSKGSKANIPQAFEIEIKISLGGQPWRFLIGRTAVTALSTE